MGGIWLTNFELLNTLSETVGYKSGLALNKQEFLEYIRDEDWKKFFCGKKEYVVRIRSEEFEEEVTNILFGIGHLESRVIPSMSTVYFVKKYKDHPEILEGIFLLHKKHFDSMIKAAEISGIKKLDPSNLMRECHNLFGIKGVEILIEFIKCLNYSIENNPFSDIRRVEWNNVIELEGLFNEASLKTSYGTFFDQRYIDYLAKNFGRIDQIHWRKFEGLTAEYFNREGFEVEIGPGQNDDGVDVRVWGKSDGIAKPLILIQCKRQKEKINKMVVKSLWADVAFEKAESGLVVTSSTFSPGASKVCRARGYPIKEANRNTLKKWLNELKSPGTGIFLEE